MKVVVSSAVTISLAGGANFAQEPLRPEEGAVRLQRVLELGDASEEPALIMPTDIDRWGDTYVVTDAGAGDLKLYSVSGEHLATLGRKGDGPGEFNRPTSVSVIDDSTAMVWDAGARRALWIDPAGTELRRLPLAEDRLYRLVANRAGVMAATATVFSGGTEMLAAGIVNSEGDFIPWPDTTVDHPSLLRGPHGERRWLTFQTNPAHVITTTSEGHFVLVRADRYEIRLLDTRKTLESVQVEHQMLAVPREIQDAYRERAPEWARRQLAKKRIPPADGVFVWEDGWICVRLLNLGDSTATVDLVSTSLGIVHRVQLPGALIGVTGGLWALANEEVEGTIVTLYSAEIQ